MILTINTYLKEVQGKGIGLFSTENVKKDTIIAINYPGSYNIFKRDMFHTYPLHLQGFLEVYGVFKDDGNIYVDIDNLRFTNHSNKPNIGCFDEYCIAIKDINKDEEITCDYYEIDDHISEFGLNFENKEQ